MYTIMQEKVKLYYAIFCIYCTQILDNMYLGLICLCYVLARCVLAEWYVYMSEW